jgi:hypothetical protein
MKKRLPRTQRTSLSLSHSLKLRLQAKPFRNRKRKNWLHVNIGEREAKNLRALAECLGITLRTFLELAIRHDAYATADSLKIKVWEAANIPRARRREIARQNWKCDQAIGWRVDSHKN